MKIFAHRGNSGEHTENSLQAIQSAVELECDGIEIDIRYHKGEFIVFHDRWLSRHTNGYGLLENYSLAGLLALNIDDNQQIPTLAQAMALIPDGVLLNIELKGKIPIDKLYNYLLEQTQITHTEMAHLLVSSFDHNLICELRTVSPDLKLGVLSGCIPTDYAQFAKDLGAFSIHLDLDAANQEIVDNAHDLGLEVYTYTVNQFDAFEWLTDLGVDGIFTDYPRQFIQRQR